MVDAQTADALRRAAGLRNVVAHGYAGVNAERLFETATSGLEDLDRFAQEMRCGYSSISSYRRGADLELK